MLMKTKELTGDALDWACAQVINLKLDDGMWFDTKNVCPLSGEWVEDLWNPSTDYEQGMSLVDGRISRLIRTSEGWEAGAYSILGDTLLEAAMRAIVYQEYGDEIDIPDHLINAVYVCMSP